MKKNAHKTSKEAAAAVAAAGAVAVGGKLAWDRLSGKPEDEREYRLHVDEAIPDGIRRIARGQLDSSAEELGKASDRKIGDAVHETRKSLKRLRAVVRVARAGIGDDRYRRENAEFRETGRLLSDARDSKVLIETLDGLTEHAGEELAPVVTAKLRSRLEDEHARALEGLRQDSSVVEAVLAKLTAARRRTPRWAFHADGFDALTPGLARTYRRGRKRMRAAAADPSTENFHEWRKRVKDFWHACQIVRPAAPKKMKRLAKRAHRLSDLLGDDHDLAVLRGYVETHPHDFADDDVRTALVALINRRRRVLQREALEVGAGVFKQSPKQFARGVERGWRKRSPEKPQPAIA